MTHHEVRRGLTLIELLVIVAIVCLLVGLLLPALQAARESARSSVCRNNVRQIIIANQAYHDNFAVYASPWTPPAGRVPNSRPVLQHFSTFTRILPFMEQRALYDTINFSLECYDYHHFVPTRGTYSLSAHRTALETRLGTLLCPSDGGDGYEPSGCNYRVNLGSDPWFYSTDGPFMNSLSPLGNQGVTDGLSNTVGFSEKQRGSIRDPNPNSRTDMYESAFSQAENENHIRYGCDDGARDAARIDGTGRSWLIGTLTHICYNHALIPNASRPDCYIGITNPINAHTAARSNHSGVNAGFLDGSVRLLTPSISLRVWRALGSRNGAELHSDR